MKCTSDDNGFFEDLGALLDGELGGARRAEVERHLESCEACREERARLKKLSSLVGDLAKPGAPGGVLASVMSSVASSGSDAAESTAGATDASKVMRLRRWIGGVSAVAAALLVGVVVFSALEREDSGGHIASLREMAPCATPGGAMADAEREEPLDAASTDGRMFKKEGGGTGASDAKAPAEVAENAKLFRATNDAPAALARPAAGPAARAFARSAPADSVALDSTHAKASRSDRGAQAPSGAAPKPVAPMPKGAERSGEALGRNARREVGVGQTAEGARRQASTPRLGVARPKEKPANEKADKSHDRLHDRLHDEGLVGERLAFRARRDEAKDAASRKKPAPATGGAAGADAEVAALAMGENDALGADRDALKLARELRALLADGEAKQKAKALAARRDTDAGGAGEEEEKIFIRLRRRTPFGQAGTEAQRIEALAKWLGGDARSTGGFIKDGVRPEKPDRLTWTGQQARWLVARIPARSAMDFVEAVESGRAAPVMGGKESREKKRPSVIRAGDDAPTTLIGDRQGVKPSADERPPVPAAETPAPVNRVASKRAERLVAIEITIETEWWSPEAAARAKVEAAKADAAKAGAAGEAEADTPAKDSAPTGR